MWKQPPPDHYQHPPPATSDPASPVHGGGHSYAQQVNCSVLPLSYPDCRFENEFYFQVGYFLQQSVPIPTVQSGGPRTTPSGYPGGPVVPSGQLEAGHGRRYPGAGGGDPGYSDNVIHGARTSASSGPMTFTRAMEVTDSLAAGAGQMPNQSGGRANGGPRLGEEGGADHRESVYDMNYEISV